jgi:hypothetical protein
MSVEVLSFRTEWLSGRCCDECKERFWHTVEFKLEGEYLNTCRSCFDVIMKEDSHE